MFIVVALGIANTILMGAMERTHEFGVMLALGTRPAQVARTVLYDALLLGLGAVALGGWARRRTAPAGTDDGEQPDEIRAVDGRCEFLTTTAEM